MPNRKWGILKQQPSRAGSGYHIGCCLVLCGILTNHQVPHASLAHCTAAAPESLTRFFPFLRCFLFLRFGFFPLSNDDEDDELEVEIDFDVKKLKMLEPCPILYPTALSSPLHSPYLSANLLPDRGCITALSAVSLITFCLRPKICPFVP